MVTMKKDKCPTCSGTKDDRKQLPERFPPQKCFDRFHFSKGDIFRCRRLKCKNTVEGRKTICDNCIAKDKAKKRKIKRNQRAIGIKATRKKKVIWKDKQTTFKSNEPLPVFYLKRKKSVIYTKFSPKGRWVKTSKQKLSSLERKFMCAGNPEFK
jgi:hypothetical protein